jgi:endonuclease G, mitochondrial
MPTFQRRGVRLPNNTLLLLFVFFVVGLFLHYGGQSEPVLKLWDDVRSVFSASPAGTANPYKVPEPDRQGTSGIPEDTAVWSENPDRPAKRSEPKSTSPATGKSTSADLERILRQRDFVLPATRPTDQVVRHTGITLQYLEKYEQAAWVAYVLPGTQVKGKEERATTFFDDPAVKTGSAVNADYSRSGYDRGHLAPAADFKNNRIMMRESFYMSNISPQVPDFNRGIWSDLEQLVRVWAIRYSQVYVVTGPVLRPGLPTIGRINRVAVPEYYYKVVLTAAPTGLKGIAFLMRNEGSRQPLSTFVVSIDEVEQVTGLDFFPRLPDEVEDRIEAQSTPTDWFRLK